MLLMKMIECFNMTIKMRNHHLYNYALNDCLFLIIVAHSRLSTACGTTVCNAIIFRDSMNFFVMTDFKIRTRADSAD